MNVFSVFIMLTLFCVCAVEGKICSHRNTYNNLDKTYCRWGCCSSTSSPCCRPFYTQTPFIAGISSAIGAIFLIVCCVKCCRKEREEETKVQYSSLETTEEYGATSTPHTNITFYSDTQNSRNGKTH